jgi:prepilin-type N-terminal cleavage/methylation domain-containing protein
MAQSRSEAGFTLLEILVAAVILAMVMTMTYAMFRWIQDASGRITEGRPRDRALRVILDRLERELSGAILLRRREGVDPLAHPWLFYAEDRVLGESDADRVRFVTQTPLHAAGEVHGRGVRIVSYGLELGEDGLPMLLRGEEEMTDELEKGIELSEGQIVAEDVAAFSLRYVGEGGMRDTWDSTAVETDNLLPLDVEVMVQLWQVDAQGELVPGTPVTRMMEIPTRPEFLESPEAASSECTTGISKRDCQERWLAELQNQNSGANGAAVIERYTNLFARVTDACWDPEEPSEELRKLKEELRLGGASTVPECPVQ